MQMIGSRLPAYDIRSGVDVTGIAGNRERSDTADSSGSARHTDSPSSGIELLPNVKHVPLHLFTKSEDSMSSVASSATSSSISSVEISKKSSLESGIATTSVQYMREEMVLSPRPYSPANYGKESPGKNNSSAADVGRSSYGPAKIILRERASSGDDSYTRRSYSPLSGGLGSTGAQHSSNEEMRGSAHDSRSLSLSPPDLERDGFMQEILSKAGRASNLNTRRQGPSLKLNTRTGFSRQYSDDLPTPTVITNMMQMIDDNIEENIAGEKDLEAVSSPSSYARNNGSSVGPASNYATEQKQQSMKLKMTVAQRLQYRQVSGGDSDSSATPPSSTDATSQPSYATMVFRSSEQDNHTLTAEETAQLDTQTPRTPKGFITPGTDMEVDPFGILKSLNIGSIPQ